MGVRGHAPAVPTARIVLSGDAPAEAQVRERKRDKERRY